MGGPFYHGLLAECAEYGYTEDKRLVPLHEPVESYDKNEQEGNWIEVTVT